MNIMKFLSVFAFFTCTFAHTIGRSLFEKKIIGGTIASDGQFPYQISQRYYEKHNCGGSIIDQKTILTAAHCVYIFPSKDATVVAGSNKLDQGGQPYKVSGIILNESWNPITFAADIAVIKVTNPIQFTTYIQPIPMDDSFIPSDTKCVLSGWGLTSYPGAANNDLLYYQGIIIDLTRCQEMMSGLKHQVLDSNICVIGEQGVAACQSDSGGPLVSKNKQIGITSWGLYPCALGFPDIYTSVFHYSKWIKMHQEKTN